MKKKEKWVPFAADFLTILNAASTLATAAAAALYFSLN